MRQILVEIKDDAKAQMLLDLLRSLDFVDLVTTDQAGDEHGNRDETEATAEFFSMAGIWSGRDVSLTSLRQQAWPKQ